MDEYPRRRMIEYKCKNFDKCGNSVTRTIKTDKPVCIVCQDEYHREYSRLWQKKPKEDGLADR